MKKIRRIQLELTPSYFGPDHYEVRLHVDTTQKQYHVIRMMDTNHFEPMYDYLIKGMAHELKQLVLAEEI